MKNLTTIIDYIRYSASEMSRAELYYGHGTDNALDEAASLVIGVLQLPFGLDIHYLQTNLTEPEKLQIINSLRARIDERVPVPYITHRTMYAGYELYIDERALIPRSPIAELVEKGLSPYWTGDRAPERILDLCAGSGAIGIVAKYRYPQAEVVLADDDSDALKVAEKNIAKCGMEGYNIDICHGDLFEHLEGKFDWILCNPPYVEAAEMSLIVEEFRHEPRHALVSGEDGLDLVRRILLEACDYLSDEGLLVVEVGANWVNLENAYPEIGFEWAELERGGEGIFVVSCDELKAWRESGLLNAVLPSM